MKKFIGGLLAFLAIFLVSGSIKASKTTPLSNHQLKTAITHMTLQQKIGQMYVSRVQTTPKDTVATLTKYQLGAIILFGPDFENQTKPQFKQRITGYQKAVQIPLLVSTDQEGGDVSRLSSNAKLTHQRSFPSPQTTYQKDGLQATIKEAKQTAKILHGLGINWNFAPVADVTDDPNSFIYARTLGTTFSKTASYIKKVVPAIQHQQVATSLKHFPGYGSAADTHTGFASTTRSLADFEANDFLTFKAGIQSGADSILVSHIVMTAVDPDLPASLSPKVHQLLRKQLKFNGVIVTDDLAMGAITKYAQQHHVSPDLLAVEAGNDMIMSDHYKTGIPAIAQAVQSGQISEHQINQSVYRILTMKNKLHLLSKNQLP